jgi:hypothetical protein
MVNNLVEHYNYITNKTIVNKCLDSKLLTGFKNPEPLKGDDDIGYILLSILVVSPLTFRLLSIFGLFIADNNTRTADGHDIVEKIPLRIETSHNS